MEDHEARIAALEAQINEVHRKLRIGKYDTPLVKAERRAMKAIRLWMGRDSNGPPRTLKHFELTAAHYEQKLADYLAARSGN